MHPLHVEGEFVEFFLNFFGRRFLREASEHHLVEDGDVILRYLRLDPYAT